MEGHMNAWMCTAMKQHAKTLSTEQDENARCMFTALKHTVFGVEAAESLQTFVQHFIVYNNIEWKSRTSEAMLILLVWMQRYQLYTH